MAAPESGWKPLGELRLRILRAPSMSSHDLRSTARTHRREPQTHAHHDAGRGRSARAVGGDRTERWGTRSCPHQIPWARWSAHPANAPCCPRS